MQELLGRITALDPEASVSLRVIACFDELIIGNVNTRALLGAAASLAGCTAGVRREQPPSTLRVTPKGELDRDDAPPAPEHSPSSAGGVTVWLERHGPPHAHDAIVLQRLALAVRVRQGQRRRDLDNRRELALLVDPSVAVEERRAAAAALGLAPWNDYRIVAAPLFAVWESHPGGPEDVVPTPFGSIHVSVVPSADASASAAPCGVGMAASVDHLHRSFTTALVALRLCAPPEITSVEADHYGDLISLLASSPLDGDFPDVELLDKVLEHSWGPSPSTRCSRRGRSDRPRASPASTTAPCRPAST